MHGANTWMGVDGRDYDALHAFQGLFNVHLMKPKTPQYQEFELRVRMNQEKEPFNMPIPINKEVLCIIFGVCLKRVVFPGVWSH